MNPQPRPFTRFRCLWTLILLLSISPVSADETAKHVLILPLTIHSEKDLTFLNKGIMEMMTSRISRSARVLRDVSAAPDQDPVQLGRDLNADYVVTGSLTLFGSTVSTDAALTRVDTGEAALRFSRLGQDSGAVLKDIDAFAAQVSQYMASISGGASPATAATAAAPAVMLPLPPPSVAPAAPAQGDATARPPLAAGPTAAEPIWRSSPFKGVINALAAGDVDGDGHTDIVVAHESRILVQKKKGRGLSQLAAFDAGKRHTLIALDTADINGNRMAEVFVTRLDAHGKLDAVVLEWNGSALQPIATNQPWYFRVTGDPEKGPILLGQRRGAPSPNDTGGLYTHTQFLAGVFELTWNGSAYQAGNRLPLPADLNIYRFTLGDIFNDRTTRTIAYSPGDQLRVYDPTGKPQWAGHETLGGSPLFLQSPSATDSRTRDRTYLSPRLIVADLDGDRLVEVVTVHNRDAAKGVVARYRKYTRGRMIVLRWNQLNMKEIWTGEEIGGYISDFSLADLNGDGRLAAVYAMVASAGIAQTESSNIVVEPIGSLSEK